MHTGRNRAQTPQFYAILFLLLEGKWKEANIPSVPRRLCSDKPPNMTLLSETLGAEKDALSNICSHHHLWSIWMQRLTLAANPHNPRVRNACELQSWRPLPDTAREIKAGSASSEGSITQQLLSAAPDPPRRPPFAPTGCQDASSKHVGQDPSEASPEADLVFQEGRSRAGPDGGEETGSFRISGL